MMSGDNKKQSKIGKYCQVLPLLAYPFVCSYLCPFPRADGGYGDPMSSALLSTSICAIGAYTLLTHAIKYEERLEAVKDKQGGMILGALAGGSYGAAYAIPFGWMFGTIIHQELLMCYAYAFGGDSVSGIDCGRYWSPAKRCIQRLKLHRSFPVSTRPRKGAGNYTNPLHSYE